VGVNEQRADRPRHSAATALCARGRQVRDEQLAQNSGGGISVDSQRIGKTAARSSWFVQYF
jgi:hypothetical protein